MVEFKDDVEVIYTCPKCKQVFKPSELSDIVQYDEDDFEYLCPNDRRVLKWGLA